MGVTVVRASAVPRSRCTSAGVSARPSAAQSAASTLASSSPEGRRAAAFASGMERPFPLVRLQYVARLHDCSRSGCRVHPAHPLWEGPTAMPLPVPNHDVLSHHVVNQAVNVLDPSSLLSSFGALG